MKLFLLLTLLLLPLSAHAKTQHQAVRDKRDKLQQEVVTCYKGFKKLNDDKKFECVSKYNAVNALNIEILQDQILNLQLATTGY